MPADGHGAGGEEAAKRHVKDVLTDRNVGEYVHEQEQETRPTWNNTDAHTETDATIHNGNEDECELDVHS
jgi:hypothetical protein